ncbi:MAG: peptide deformylase [Prevotellaceae bacterium]|jgi:peptide deformylase|nr:peptide deformylase [Prevotellaceae bacterium]
MHNAENLCKNCGNTTKNSYCDVCGQPTNTQRIKFSSLILQVTTIFNLDRGFLFTIKRLFTNPSGAIKEYLSGKRVRYSKPFGLVFIVVTVYVILSYWLNAQMESIQLSGASALDVEMKSATQGYTESIYSYYSYIQLLTIPLYAFSAYIFFKSDGYNYAEHCVINAYITAGSTVISIAYLPVIAYFHSSVEAHYWSMIPITAYSLFVYIQLFKRSSLIIRFIKAFGAAILSTLSVLFTIMIISTAIIMTSMFSHLQTDNLLTKSEKELINGADTNTPFRVLPATNETDSLFLRKKCTNLSFEQNKDDILHLVERLKVTLDAEQGVGIAAPQVGIARNLFLFVRTDKPDYPVEVAINPHIVNHPDETICFERDGCLSIPDTSGNSIRYPWVEVEYTNERGELIRERLEGYSRSDSFVAVIFQHEYDHLQGILFTDKLCD